ncbi:MAG: hypothetical protein ABEJ99_02305 [Candidatus Nanohaloarchaea archaeon]
MKQQATRARTDSHAVSFSFNRDRGIFLGDSRRVKEDPELAEDLGVLEESSIDYHAHMIDEAEAMHDAAQPTVSCIADSFEEFERFEKDENTFFTSLERNGETLGYARGHLIDDVYWLDTVKLPSTLNHSRYEEFSDLHRTAVLAHSEIGDMTGAQHKAGASHYLVAPDFHYSADDNLTVDQLYLGINSMDLDIERGDRDVKMENDPAEYPELVYSLP